MSDFWDFWEGRDGAQVVYDLVLAVQVCVPEGWTDEEVEQFGVEYEVVNNGRDNPCFSVRKGTFKGDPERNPCEDRQGYVHVMLLA